MGIIIHSLESVSFKDLYAAFSSAFKDYDFSLNADELRRMLDRRGYNPQLSFGAFFEGRLISFVFNGTGMYNNILTAYDTGTGTVPSFRGLHLTQKIFTFSLELIYQQGVRQYVLEVLQHNHKAIKIYRKLGFETQRNFNYYSAKLSDIVPVLQVNHTACRILPSDLKNCLNQTAWFDFHPSWQNDRASLERGIDNLDILGAYEREELVGFVIFEPASGDISSLAVAKDYRRKGIGMPLAEFFREIANKELECKVSGFSSEARKALLTHSWPGNVRELRQKIMGAVLQAQTGLVTKEHLELGITETTSVTGFSLRNDEEDKERILRALKQADGNRKVAAELLGIGRTTLYNKLEEYGLKYKFEQP